MNIQETIVNKVATSGLITFDLGEYYQKGERLVYDIKDNLFHGLMLKEKDFREFVKNHDFSIYSGKNVAIICSTDAIVPTWAYMLLANKISPFANCVVVGSLQDLEIILFERALDTVDFGLYKDQRVVVKGCSDIDVPVFAYAELTNRLTKVAKSIMYGEPCSTVPIFKRKEV